VDPPSAIRLKSDPTTDLGTREKAIVEHLRAHGASFFGPLHEAVGGGYPAETVDALWTLVWRGLLTNDSFHAMRAFTAVGSPRRRARRVEATAFRSRRLVPPAAEGRWALVGRALSGPPRVDGPHTVRPTTTTNWATATAQQLLARHGVLTREAVAAESLPGGFGIVYPVLKAMEEAGRLRRGYFVAGLGATQFALPGALDLLRSFRAGAPDADGRNNEVLALAATDPANPYGTTLKWPAFAFWGSGALARQACPSVVEAASARQAPAADGRAASAGRGPSRSVGATVILVDGALAAHLARGNRVLLTWLPDSEPLRSKSARAVARMLIERPRTGGDSPRGMLIEEIDGVAPGEHPMAPFLVESGFLPGAMGFQAKLRI
jgi:ATP-dependent Lhr-like helicase